jgi:translation initiation factor 3 subunit D
MVREGDNLFLDKRDGGPFDTVTVNENASDPPQDPTPPNPNNPVEKAAIPETPSINSATSLSLEATYINQNFSFQSVIENPPSAAVDFAHPNPFYGPDETEPLASCGYRYRVFDLGITENEDVKICVRTEVDAYSPGTGNPIEGHGLVTIRALNEFDPRAQGAGGAPDWRSKLDSQRGAVVATEMKNNSCKLAKWTVQSVLAGADLMKIGYVRPMSPRFFVPSLFLLLLSPLIFSSTHFYTPSSRSWECERSGSLPLLDGESLSDRWVLRCFCS